MKLRRRKQKQKQEEPKNLQPNPETGELSSVELKWVKVETPQPWSPKAPDDVLEGAYGGSIVKYNRRTDEEYVVHVVHTYTDSRYVSGVIIDQLFQSAQVKPGEMVRVIFKGTKPTTNGHDMKLFELYKGIA